MSSPNRGYTNAPTRATTPGGVAPTSGRYQPPARAGERPTGSTISRPTTTSPGSTSRPGYGGGRSAAGGNAIDSRYRPAPGAERAGNVARPTAGVEGTNAARPTAGSERTGNIARPTAGNERVTAGGRPTTNTDGAPRAGLSPRQSTGSSAAGNRYAPRDTTPTPGAARRPTAGAGRATAGTTTPRPGGRVTTATPENSAIAPVAPRLSGPRSSITSGAVARYSPYCQPGGSYWNNCYGSTWCGSYDPWCGYGGWGWCGGWGFSIGFGGCGWGISFGYPYWYGCTSYWGGCYNDALWCSWAYPYCAPAGYWWYPSSTYCPTYLYVPSSVYVVESAPAEATTTEVVAAGGRVAGAARAVELGPDADTLAKNLAAKYVELGDFYFRAARFREAAEAYGKARSYAPNDASVHFVLADAVFADGDYPYAAFLIAEGLRLDPAMASAETDKRTFYGDASLFDAQMAALDRHLERAPYDAQAHFVRGYNLRYSGRKVDAVVAFRRVLEIAPEHRGAMTFLAALEGKPAGEPAGR